MISMTWRVVDSISAQAIKGEISSSFAYLAAGRHSDLDIWARWQLRVAAFVLSPWLLDMDLSLVGDMCVFFSEWTLNSLTATVADPGERIVPHRVSKMPERSIEFVFTVHVFTACSLLCYLHL